MRRGVLFSLGSLALAFEVAAQSAVDVTRPEERQKERRAVVKEQEKRAGGRASSNFAGSRLLTKKNFAWR